MEAWFWFVLGAMAGATFLGVLLLFIALNRED